MTAYERALLEQIAYLRAELERVREQRQHAPPTPEEPPIKWAMCDPNFRQWLLKKQLEREVRQ